MKLKISIIYDNKSLKPFKHGWGFSALINIEKRNILFDTGADSEILFYNIKKLNIDPNKIDTIILSHSHLDHSGGLLYILGLKEKFDVYLPKYMNPQKKAEFRSYGGNETRFIETDGIQTISDNIKSVCTREIFEQYLMIHLSKGILILTGCAHPGLSKIIDYTEKYGKIYGIMGGFHGFAELEKLKNIQFIAPCHCTGQINEIKDMYPERFIDCAAGCKYEFE